jgi:hypothetical protein
MILQGGKKERTKQYNYIARNGDILTINLKNEFKKCNHCKNLLHYQNFYSIYDKVSLKYYLLPKCVKCYKILYEEKNNNNDNNNN